MLSSSVKPAWASLLPHGHAILLLTECEVLGEHRVTARTRLAETVIGQQTDGDTLPILWGLEILAQAAATLPVHGDPLGPRQGYLVKADQVVYRAASLPLHTTLLIDAERLNEASNGLNLGRGTIRLADNPDALPLFEARFFLWNRAGN